jgi:hypothetical protein
MQGQWGMWAPVHYVEFGGTVSIVLGISKRPYLHQHLVVYADCAYVGRSIFYLVHCHGKVLLCISKLIPCDALTPNGISYHLQ